MESMLLVTAEDVMNLRKVRKVKVYSLDESKLISFIKRIRKSLDSKKEDRIKQIYIDKLSEKEINETWKRISAKIAENGR